MMIEGIIPILVLLLFVLTVVLWIGNFIRLYISRSHSSKKSNNVSAERFFESFFEKKANTEEHKTCPFCKEEINSDAVKCKHCYSFLNTKNRNSIASMTGKKCPYCQFPIKQDSEVLQCPGCKVPHHRECWEENEGCTTFGCNGSSF